MTPMSPKKPQVIFCFCVSSNGLRESNGRSVPSSGDGRDGGSSSQFTNPSGLPETRPAGSTTAARQDAVVPRSSSDGSDGGSSSQFTNPSGLTETHPAGSTTAARQDAVVPRSSSDPIGGKDPEGGPTSGEQPLNFTGSIFPVAVTCSGAALSSTLLVANKGGLPKAVLLAGASGMVLSLGTAVSGIIYGCSHREQPAASTWMKRIAYSALCLSILSTAGLVCASVFVN